MCLPKGQLPVVDACEARSSARSPGRKTNRVGTTSPVGGVIFWDAACRASAIVRVRVGRQDPTPLPCILASMTADTLADLEARNVTHVRIVSHCVIQAVPWPLLPVPASTPFAEVAQRLRCSRCGQWPDPENVSSWAARCRFQEGCSPVARE